MVPHYGFINLGIINLVVLHRDVVKGDMDPVEGLNYITSMLRPLLVQKTQEPGSAPYRGSWFDKECRLAKKHLTRLIRKTRQTRLASDLDALTQCRSTYKELLKQKKSAHMSAQWKELGKAVMEKNEKMFWSLISTPNLGLSSKMNDCIAAGTWCSYFCNIFDSDANARQNNVSNSQSLLALTPEWPPVTEQEVGERTDTLATEKAPGEDMIPPDVYKTNIEW